MTNTQTVQQEQSLFERLEDMGHEQLVFCQDKKTGLKAIIGIHNTVCGPALGGTRMWTYDNEQDAVNDVMRLSRGMTFKNAVAGLNLGGGKAVIIGDARTQKNEALMRRFGKFVESLSGKYITAEDVGMSARDMEHILMETKHVCGIPESRGGSGDPSPFTALGTYVSMKAAAKKAYGSDSLEGKKVVVQGVGHVGQYLVDHLIAENAEVIITDIFDDRLQAVTSKHSSVTVVSPDAVYDTDADIYAPCALGATVNDDTLERLKCRIIAGAANNQLADEERHGNACLEKGIIYAPDFLINAGGVINVYSEVEGLGRDWSTRKTEELYDRTLHVLETSLSEGKNAQHVAIEMALDRIDQIAHIRTTR